MTELQKYLDANKELSKNSIKSYKNIYTRLRNYLADDITETSNKKIIEAVYDITENNNSRQSLLNIAFVIKKNANCNDLDKLIKERDKLKDKILSSKFKSNIELQDKLPSYTELEVFLQNLYQEGKWRQFIVNYLLFNYGLRNLDVNLLIVYDKNDVTTFDNYLLLRSKDVVININVYKTFKTYGSKKIICKDRALFNAVKKLKAQPLDPLLMNSNGDRVTEESLAEFVQKQTYKQIGEGNYYKINVFHHKNKDFDKIIQLSKTRGTNIETILNSYDITNID